MVDEELSRMEQRRKERQELYQSKRWKEIRALYYQAHPLCERCLKEGRITPAHDIHHKLSPFAKGLTPEEKERRAFEWSNLMAVCVECHIKEHQKDIPMSKKLDKYKD